MRAAGLSYLRGSMKRVVVGVCLIFFVFAALMAVSAPLIKRSIKYQIVADLKHFIREGRLEVENVSVSPKRREARLLGVSVIDSNGNTVIRIQKIDVRIRRMHRRHIDASLRVFAPEIFLNLEQLDSLSRLLRTEAFFEKSRFEFDRVDVQEGQIALTAPGILAVAETLPFVARAQLEGDPTRSLDFQADGPKTSMRLRVRLNGRSDNPYQLEGTGFELLSGNISLIPRLKAADFADTNAASGLRIQLFPADTLVPSLDTLQLNAFFSLGPLQGSFLRIHPSAETPGIYKTARMRFSLGHEMLVCDENDLDIRGRDFRVSSKRWIRAQTGLTLEDVHLSAGPNRSEFGAGIAGQAIAAAAEWRNTGDGSPPRVRLSFDGNLPVPTILHEVGESIPLDGFAKLHAEAEQEETAPNQIRWRAEILSRDLRLGPAFGKISCRANLSLRGRGGAVEELAGNVEPAGGLPIFLSGKSTVKGFSGRATLKDRTLKDIQLLGEAFGEKIPLVGETGVARLDVDFSVDRNLKLVLRGHLRIKDATAMSRGFPFRVDGLDVDIPFEVAPDTGKLVVSDAAAGGASARSLDIGPYRFENFSLTTASKGDKLYLDFSPIAAFGGTVRAKLLFHFSEEAHQHAELAVDSVSLSQILAPFPEAHGAISGLVDGEARFYTRGGDLLSARGTLRARAAEGWGEPMRVSRKFLEQIGGNAIRELDLPGEVAYKNGSLKVRLSEGRLLFEEARLEAQTILRKIRIGKIVGSYKLKDLIDVLSNVSAQNVKIDFERKKIGGKKQK